MFDFFTTKASKKIILIIPILIKDLSFWYEQQSSFIKNQIITYKFLLDSVNFCFISDKKGCLSKVLLKIRNENDFLSFGELPPVLPKGYYEIFNSNFSYEQLTRFAIGWGFGSYKFDKYKKIEDCNPKLVCCNDKYDLTTINNFIETTFFVRNLINTPAIDLYPEKLALISKNIANKFNLKLQITKGPSLIKEYPAVYAIGKGSNNQPLVIDLHYGNVNHPKVVLIGKGVCFDSGGLQLKSSSAMLNMKKDMAGAAHVLALLQLIALSELPINLRVIIPAVENMISGNSIKPGDIVKTRSGRSIEISNTDAEGRVILSDILSIASEWKPKLILDFATLTGAARVALGPEVTALFTNNDILADKILEQSLLESEPLWRLPLYEKYSCYFKSKLADIKNIADSEYVSAGAIIGALILKEFITDNVEWAHFDINGYNSISKPGKPEGGETCCLISVFKYLKSRFTKI